MKNKDNFIRVLPSLLAIVVDGLSFSLVYPLIAMMFSEFYPNTASSPHLAHLYLGLSFMLHPFFMLFGAPILGKLSDIWGRKKILIFCSCGITISFLIMGISTLIFNIWWLLIGRALSGFMAGAQVLAQAAVADLSDSSNKVMNMRLITSALSIGYILGPVIGGLFSDRNLISFVNFSTPFFIATVISFVNLIWIFFSFKETYLPKPPTHMHDEYDISKFFKNITQNHIIFTLSIAYLLMQIGFSLFFQLMPILLKFNFNYSNWMIGTFNGLIGLSFSITLLCIAKIALNIWKAKNLVISCLLITALAQIIISFSHNQLIIWILTFLLACTDMLALNIILSFYSISANKESQGFTMGVSGAMRALSWAITGLSPNLMPFVSTEVIILMGGLAMLLSSFIMIYYCRKYSNLVSRI